MSEWTKAKCPACSFQEARRKTFTNGYLLGDVTMCGHCGTMSDDRQMSDEAKGAIRRWADVDVPPEGATIEAFPKSIVCPKAKA